jgi:hypothetical protein
METFEKLVISGGFSELLWCNRTACPIQMPFPAISVQLFPPHLSATSLTFTILQQLAGGLQPFRVNPVPIRCRSTKTTVTSRLDFVTYPVKYLEK